jgi:hypothetical protein
MLIRCDDSAMHQALARYFRHCIGGTAPVATTYQVMRPISGSRMTYVCTHLARDIATRLVTCDRQHMVFHAAGLAYNRRGVILCGPPGCGKSTLAAWLTASGFNFLSDEVVAVTLDSMDDREVREMYGLTCPIVLKGGSAFVWQHWLGEDAAQGMVHALDDTVWVDPESLRSHSVCAMACPRLLVFPQYGGHGAFDAQRLSSAEAAFRLMHQLVNFESLPAQGFSTVTRFVQHIPAYRVAYTDVTEVEAWLGERIME